jgi:hypothetical protein
MFLDSGEYILVVWKTGDIQVGNQAEYLQLVNHELGVFSCNFKSDYDELHRESMALEQLGLDESEYTRRINELYGRYYDLALLIKQRFWESVQSNHALPLVAGRISKTFVESYKG